MQCARSLRAFPVQTSSSDKQWGNRFPMPQSIVGFCFFGPKARFCFDYTNLRVFAADKSLGNLVSKKSKQEQFYINQPVCQYMACNWLSHGLFWQQQIFLPNREGKRAFCLLQQF
jgi:hypothetical protein